MPILDPGFNHTLRPMRYPSLYNHFVDAQKNNWTVQEISFSTDKEHLRDKLTVAEKQVVQYIVAFFATGDSIVGENAVLNLYKHVNSPEARLYYSRQIFEEALHVQFYLTLLDEYLPDPEDRAKAFAALEEIPSIKRKGDFCFKYLDQSAKIDRLETEDDRRTFLLNLITFAAAIEGLFFFGAFSYVYYLRSKGYLHGLGSGTNWVFRDESMHMKVAFELVDLIRSEYPELWTADFETTVSEMIDEAIACEYQFAEEALALGVAGMTKEQMLEYLQYIGDARRIRLGMAPKYNKKNPFPFMELQDLSSHTNFFERTVSDYAVGIGGDVTFDDELDF
jgi:ribonucleoside-diphosphate reductase beta chain